jgi:hypothetical protein
MNRQPSERRQIAGRLNRAKRKLLSLQTRQTLRAAALRNRPWLRSTGPRTAAGRAQSAANGKRRQKGQYSVRELQRKVTDVTNQVKMLRQLRAAACRLGDCPKYD